MLRERSIFLLILLVAFSFACSENSVREQADYEDADGDADEEEEVNSCPANNCATLSGKVTLAGEEDHTGIIVSLIDTDLFSITDASGNYYLSDIPPGLYEIVFDAPENSGFESGVSIRYQDFAENSDVNLPEFELGRGRNLIETEGCSVVDFPDKVLSNDELGIAFFKRNSSLYKYSKEDKKLQVLAENVVSYKVSPDRSHVIYFSNNGAESLHGELYSIPVEGVTATLLKTDAQNSYQISPDSKWIVFFTSYTSEVGKLYSVPISGGEAASLGQNAFYGSKNTVHLYTISPDSSRVLFIKDYELIGTTTNFYSVSISGGEATSLGKECMPNSPNSTTVSK